MHFQELIAFAIFALLMLAIFAFVPADTLDKDDQAPESLPQTLPGPTALSRPKRTIQQGPLSGSSHDRRIARRHQERTRKNVRREIERAKSLTAE